MMLSCSVVFSSESKVRRREGEGWGGEGRPERVRWDDLAKENNLGGLKPGVSHIPVAYTNDVPVRIQRSVRKRRSCTKRKNGNTIQNTIRRQFTGPFTFQ